MKILHYINHLGSGGAEKLLTDILPIMKEKGHEVHLAYANGKKNVSKFDKIFEEKSIRIINLRTSIYNPLQTINLISLIRNEKYDIVHTHLFPTNYWAAFASFLKPSKTRFIKTEHNGFKRDNYKYFKFLERITYNRYDKLIGITDEVTEKIGDWVNVHQKMVTINNGLNLQQISEEMSAKHNSDFEFIKKENYNILMVGRLDPGVQKDQTSLIRSLAKLPADCQLFFAGEGGRKKELQILAAELNLQNRVNFLGLRSDVYALMNLMDLNVLSTNYEGLSGVALESLASGTPFIGADVVGVNNVVPDDTFLFPKRNPDALAAKILTIKNSEALQNELVEKALAHVLKFDINIMADKYLDLYESAINDKRITKQRVH